MDILRLYVDILGLYVDILCTIHGYPWLFRDIHGYLKGHALCRQPLLASRGCHLGGSVPPFRHSGRPFYHLESTLGDYFDTSGPPWKPWEQQDGCEMLIYWNLFDFGVILGSVYISFVSPKNLKFFFCCSGLFPGHLFIDVWIEISMLGTYKSRFSHWMYCKTRFFMEFVFDGCRGRFLLFLGILGSRFLGFLGFENRLANKGTFGDEADAE